MAENKDHLWKAPEESADKLEDLVKGGSHPVGIDVGTSKVVVSRRGGKEVGLPVAAQRLHPGPLLAGHRAHDPAAERHPLLPRRRRDRDLRLGHRALREHVQRRGAPADGRRPAEPEGEAGLAGARGDPAEPGAEAALLERGARVLGAGRRARARVGAHLPRGEPAPALQLARLQGDGDQRGPGGDLRRARAAQLHGHRHLLRRRHVQRDARVPLDPVDHGLAAEGGRLHRPLGGRRGRRARARA